MSRLGRPFQAIGRRLREVHRSLGPRWTAALAVGVLAAAGVGAAVALAGGPTSAPRAGTTAAHVTTQSTSASTTASGLASANGGAAAKDQRSSAAKRAKHVVPAKRAAKHAGSQSASASHHSGAATHTTSPSHGTARTTTTATTTATTTTPSARPVPITLDLHGGGNASLLACGAQHHFRTYAGGSSIAFTGRVRPRPSGQWKVELHTKICQGGVFQDFLKYDAHINPRTGAFYGTFRAPPRGLYEFESVLYLGSTETATESDNVSIEIR
jgi:hypothetical protein